MRCGRFDLLVDRYVDGALDERLAAQVQEHGRACGRCAARLESARELAGGLAAAPPVRAPRGFADAVMDAVSREALKGGSSLEAAAAAAAAPGRRRLGLSVLLAGAVLTASLFVPQETWVRQALDGADRAVRLALDSVEGRSR